MYQLFRLAEKFFANIIIDKMDIGQVLHKCFTSRSLAYIHSNGICHRDIKPQVILGLCIQSLQSFHPESSAWSRVRNPQAVRLWKRQASGQRRTQRLLYLLSILQVSWKLSRCKCTSSKCLQSTWADLWSHRLHNEHWCVERRLRFCRADVGPGWWRWMDWAKSGLDVSNPIARAS